MSITIIFVNYNSSADLLEAVDSLKASAIPKNFVRKIVVVDNDNPSNLKEISGVEVLRPGKNLGFTGANNLAIRKFPADFYLLLNPDVIVKKDFLTNLTNVTNSPNFGLASPKIYFYPGFEFHKERYAEKDLGKVIWYAGGEIDWKNVVGKHKNVDLVDQPNLTNSMETDFCTGCCLLIKNEVVEKIGLLDEKLFFSWEDTDYSARAKKAGFKIVYVPKSVIWHKNANTSGGAGSLTQDFYQTRNRLIFAFKYAPVKTRFLLLWQLLKTANLNRLRAIVNFPLAFLG
ncbi:glycosyltransferase family 2 protein [Candidatus Gottesmanbacteria bacterium]|nr:glycosyltransferase family 2 protein [Candidatus Gottesmanbacteria bacterium]